MYHREVKKEYKKQHVYSEFNKMFKDSQMYSSNKESKERKKDFKRTIKKKFDSFHSKTRRIKIKVSNKMRRKFAGEQPWSPKYKRYSQAIELWRRMVRLKKKVNTSRKALKKISKSLELPWIMVSATSLQGCKKKLKEAYKRYNKKKKDFKKDRNEFNNSLIDALAEEESKRSKLEISDLSRSFTRSNRPWIP